MATTTIDILKSNMSGLASQVAQLRAILDASTLDGQHSSYSNADVITEKDTVDPKDKIIAELQEKNRKLEYRLGFLIRAYDEKFGGEPVVVNIKVQKVTKPVQKSEELYPENNKTTTAIDAPKKIAKPNNFPATNVELTTEIVDPLPDPSKVDLRIGRILSVKRHPDADSLYVEQIDLGEEKPRTVVSGLVGKIEMSDMEGRLIVIICNLKPAKMRGIESQAMVLAATSKEGKVELIDAPEGSKPGDRAMFEGYSGIPDTQLNPKKKIFESIQPHLRTDGSFRAGYIIPDGSNKFCPLTTASGVCCTQTAVGASLK